MGADLGGDGEAGGHRQADAAHFSEVRAFAAEQRLHRAVASAFCCQTHKRIFLLP